MTTIGTSILTHDDSLLGVGKIKLLLKLNNEKKNPPSEDLDSVIGDPDPAPGDTFELRKRENLGAALLASRGFIVQTGKQRDGLWPREKMAHHA